MEVNPKYTAAQFPVLTPGAKAAAIKNRGASAEPKKAFSVTEGIKPEASLQPGTVDGEKATLISDAEKRFFAELFPGAAGDIQSYSPYQKNGTKQAVALGTLIDVKG